jgi:hypothetical protein
MSQHFAECDDGKMQPEGMFAAIIVNAHPRLEKLQKWNLEFGIQFLGVFSTVISVSVRLFWPFLNKEVNQSVKAIYHFKAQNTP